jgi:dipeptidyl aminopeptidase/acylaminoacyl peptidase
VLTESHDKDWEIYNLIRPELFKYQNRHGDTISAFMFKPFNWKPEDKRPAIVYVYGGPLGNRHIVESDTFHSSAYIFQMYMAAKHGFVTLAVDTRGHSGYGKRFDDANFDQVGRPQVEDLEDLVKHLEQGFGVDTRRLGLTGWSFGGFQTQMTLYTSPDTFACGVAGAGPTEWENYNSWYSGQTISKSVRGKPTLRKFSLLPLAKNLKKPLLLIHGMEDTNVLYQDTVNIYKALLEAGKETLVDLFLDPEGEHGLGGLILNKGRFNKFEDWFLKHLGSGN